MVISLGRKRRPQSTVWRRRRTMHEDAIAAVRKLARPLQTLARPNRICRSVLVPGGRVFRCSQQPVFAVRGV